MTEISFIRGDATSPQASGKKIIAHICNDAGGWGKGFVLAVSNRWREPESEFRRWFREGRKGNFALGAVQFVSVAPYITVANMIGQAGTKAGSKGPPIRYDAVERCLKAIASKALESQASVHMPRIGCGLAGGKWELIEPIVIKTLCSAGVTVFVYDY